MEKKYDNSTSAQRQLSGLPPPGKLHGGQPSGTKNKGFKSAQRSSNFQRVGNSISGNNTGQALSMHNGSTQGGASLKNHLKPARMSHQIAPEEYNNLSEELQHLNSLQ